MPMPRGKSQTRTTKSPRNGEYVGSLGYIAGYFGATRLRSNDAIPSERPCGQQAS